MRKGRSSGGVSCATSPLVGAAGILIEDEAFRRFAEAERGKKLCSFRVEVCGLYLDLGGASLKEANGQIEPLLSLSLAGEFDEESSRIARKLARKQRPVTSVQYPDAAHGVQTGRT